MERRPNGVLFTDCVGIAWATAQPPSAKKVASETLDTNSPALARSIVEFSAVARRRSLHEFEEPHMVMGTETFAFLA
jgi:hypothetical protein